MSDQSLNYDLNRIRKRVLFGLFGNFLMCCLAIPAVADSIVSSVPIEPFPIEEGLEGEITIGGAGAIANKESYKQGEYTGIVDDTGYFLGDADLRYHRGPYYMDFQTEDLGLPNRHVYFKTGNFGNYSLTVDHQEIPHLINNVNLTPYLNSGSNSLLLNSGSQGANTGAITIQDSRNNLRIDRTTENVGLNTSFGLFDLDMKYRNDSKRGLMSLGGTFGNSANPAVVRSVVLPEPVDQAADEVYASLAHNGEKGQVELKFNYSSFDNNIESITFQNPFNNAGAPPTGLIPRAPDNESWRVGMSGGYNLPLASRVSASLEYGIMEQNEKLFPFAVGSAVPLPRDRAQANIRTLNASFSFSSRPLARLGLNVRYRYYRTDNRMPVQPFQYIVNDTGGQVGVDESITNLAYDYNRNHAEATASYYLFKGTTLKGSYKFDYTQRDFRAVRETSEQEVKGGISSRYFSNVVAGYNFSYGLRTEVDPYSEQRVCSQRFPFIATPCDGSTSFINHPEVKQFDLAEKARVRNSANLTFLLSPANTIGLVFNSVKDDYRTSTLGLEFAKTMDATLDYTYTPTEKTSFNVFYTYENIQFRQNSRSFNPFAPGSENDITRNWLADQDNDVHTVGTGLRHVMWNDKLTLDWRYSFSYSIEDIDFQTGGSASFGTVQDVPNLVTKWHRLSATSTYRVAQNTDIGFQYIFDSYNIDDFATDFFDPGSGTIPEVLTLTGTVPDYTAHQFLLFFTYIIGS